MARKPKAREYQGPTLRDVAERANVSEMTASRVIRSVGYVSDSTRERVLLAAKELGYVPNMIAGGLASNRVNLVGVIIPSMRNIVFPEVLSGISKGLQNTGLQPVFGVSDYSLETEEQVIRDMLSWRPSGLILAGLEHTQAALNMLKNAGIPIIEVMDVDGTPVDINVGISHTKAGRLIAELAVSKGYRRFGFAGGRISDDSRALKRREGFEQALKDAGLPPPIIAHYDSRSSLAQGRRLTAELLAHSTPPDCIYFSSDVLTAGGLIECQAQGLSVPDDIALAGFNGLDLIEGMPKQLATIRSPRFEIGLKASELLLKAMNDELSDAERRVEFLPEVFEGETL